MELRESVLETAKKVVAKAKREAKKKAKAREAKFLSEDLGLLKSWLSCEDKTAKGGEDELARLYRRLEKAVTAADHKAAVNALRKKGVKLPSWL